MLALHFGGVDLAERDAAARDDRFLDAARSCDWNLKILHLLHQSPAFLARHRIDRFLPIQVRRIQHFLHDPSRKQARHRVFEL